MKIIFICGSMEPGCDGVGDYTRRLAVELIRSGHNVSAIALNDTYILSEVLDDQFVEEISLPVYRIPSSKSSSQRCHQAKTWLNKINPDWLSLQFVPFAFHSKGLPFSFSRDLRILTDGQLVHFMFHEGWVGPEIAFSLRKKLYSIIQKEVIRGIIESTRPAVIHTHLPFYMDQLKKLGWQARCLPLFSNIPVVKKVQSSKKDIFRVGLFGQLDSNNSIISFLLKLKKQVTLVNMQLEVLLIGGRNKGDIRSAINRFDKEENLKFNIRSTGYLPPRGISLALQSCTMGLTPVPLHALGKSGSVAAFIAHSIPVAAPHLHFGFGLEEIGFFSANLRTSIILHPEIRMIESAKKIVEEAKHEIDISKIARKMESDIKNALHEPPRHSDSYQFI